MKSFWTMCALGLALLLAGGADTTAQTHAGLNLNLVHASRDSVTFRAEMFTPQGVSFQMEAVYVAVTYDPAHFTVTTNSIMNHRFAVNGFQKDSRHDFDNDGVNPDIAIYGESHPNFGNITFPANASVNLCRFAFWPKFPNVGGTTSFCVAGNSPTAAITGYYINTSVDNQIFDPVTCLQNVYFPVELSAFTAGQHGSLVLLQWTTQSETGNHGFQVERRAEAGDWEMIGFVQGAGTTTQQRQYTLLDQSLTTSGLYEYRLRQIDLDGTENLSDVRRVRFTTGATAFALEQNYPNPVSASGAAPTSIRYSIAEHGTVRLTVSDVLGRTVAVLMDDVMDAGTYTRTWTPQGVPAGLYLVTLEATSAAGTQRTSMRMNVVR